MSTPVLDCLNGQHDNYILPFLWLHGEGESVLREYMGAIHAAGIGAVCVESRPHPDFLGPQWWRDLDIVLDEARKRNMKVWILDDRHFPTGQAGGAMEAAPAKMQKWYLACNMVDVCGPQRQVRLSVDKLARTPLSPLAPGQDIHSDDHLFAVTACRLDGDIHRALDHVGSHAIDLTARVEDGTLLWDVPAGMWRVFVFYKTRNGGSENYINLIDAASCKVLLDTVYEAHYAHYANDFGKTIAGFFSDEPGLGNLPGNPADCLIGQRRMNLPWSAELEDALQKAWDGHCVESLPALWCEYGSKQETAQLRVDYMDCVTKLVQSCFSEQLGNWCRAHGVEYIGHIIEDNNAAEGLGASIGHYFRALWGQDMAGIDDIGAQITMGGANVEHLSFAGSGDGEFYHHVLGKLGSSLAHIDPKKRDRCVCECFGAYGWSEGTQLMKYIADHMLADGVNRFVPHAFSAKRFPDMDCPPHFYAGGEDILYPAFGKLMGYINRVSHILSGHQHTAPVALLYHAEAAWSGGNWMKMQKCARVLREHQIDFDIIPAELLALDRGVLAVNGRCYEALVIPGCEYLPPTAMRFCEDAAGRFPVYFAGFAPEDARGTVLPLEELPATLGGLAHVRLTPQYPDIRVYHGTNDGDHVYFLFNSSSWATFEGKLEINYAGRRYRYDAMENRLYQADGTVRLGPCESILFLTTDVELDAADQPEEPVQSLELAGTWQISILEDGRFVPQGETDALDGFHKPGWSGTIRYECSVSLPAAARRVVLELPQVRETATVRCNGVSCGEAIAAPFRFDLSAVWQEGENRLTIDVTTTMEQKVFAASGGRDLFTAIQKLWPAYGLVGAPILRY